MEKVWIVEYTPGNSGIGRSGTRLFRERDRAFKESFDVNFDFFRNELKTDIENEEKCKNPAFARRKFREQVKDDKKINLLKRGLSHIEKVKSLDLSWEEKASKIWETVIPLDDEPDCEFVSLNHICCTNLVPDVFIYPKSLE